MNAASSRNRQQRSGRWRLLPLSLLILLAGTATSLWAAAEDGRAPGAPSSGRSTAPSARADVKRISDVAVTKPSPPRLIFTGGRIIDGTGNPWYRGDIVVEGDRIVAVGNFPGPGVSAGGIGSGDSTRRQNQHQHQYQYQYQYQKQDRFIDISGYYVAPGFIDTHSHAGPGLATPALSAAEPLLTQGISTVFVNPDGGGAVDIVAQRDALLRDGLGVNVAQFVPHGAVREAVLGMADRAPSDAELEQMRGLVRTAMAAGAWGLSSGPFYAPGSYASTDELITLAKVAAAYGGVYQSHVRDESNYGIGLLSALDEVVTIARDAGLPGVHTHVKALGPPVWGFANDIVKAINEARAAGVEVYADQYPYLASATSLAAALVPRWAQAGGADALRKRLNNEGDAARIRRAIAENLDRRGGAERIQLRSVSWDPSLEGQRLADVANAWEISAVEAAQRMVLKGGAGIVSFNMDEDDVRTLMRQPWTMTASDGGLIPFAEGVPHPRSYGTFPHKLRRYVFEENAVSLEDAIRSMTALPAQVYRLQDRGLVRSGMLADLVVLDPVTLRDHATYTEPHQLSTGVVHLLIGGIFAIEDRRLTERLPGAVLRR